MKLPTIKDISALVRALKPDIDDSYVDEPGGVPSICLTIGWCSNTGAWSWQTGDNSYTGGAYFYPHWAVVYVSRRCDSRGLARGVRAQLLDLAAQGGV